MLGPVSILHLGCQAKQVQPGREGPVKLSQYYPLTCLTRCQAVESIRVKLIIDRSARLILNKVGRDYTLIFEKDRRKNQRNRKSYHLLYIYIYIYIKNYIHDCQ